MDSNEKFEDDVLDFEYTPEETEEQSTGLGPPRILWNFSSLTAKLRALKEERITSNDPIFSASKKRLRQTPVSCRRNYKKPNVVADDDDDDDDFTDLTIHVQVDTESQLEQKTSSLKVEGIASTMGQKVIIKEEHFDDLEKKPHLIDIAGNLAGTLNLDKDDTLKQEIREMKTEPKDEMAENFTGWVDRTEETLPIQKRSHSEMIND